MSSSGTDHNQSVGSKCIPGVKSKQSTISFRYNGHIIPWLASHAINLIWTLFANFVAKSIIVLFFACLMLIYGELEGTQYAYGT